MDHVAARTFLKAIVLNILISNDKSQMTNK